MGTVLIVDDRADVRDALAEDLEESGCHVVTAGDGVEGWTRFRETSPDLVITDLRMPREDGIELLRRVRSVASTPVILLTAYGDISTAVAAMRSGATEFLTFPEELGRAVERARELLAGGPGATREAELLTRLPGRSGAMRRLRHRVGALAPLAVPVLVSGEPGSGRDQAIRTIHWLSRAPEDLVRVRPSDRAAHDAWTRALDAPIYLDEVERHPPDAHERWYERLRRVGATGNPGVFRLFASTSADLDELAVRGQFHPGLAHALTRFTVSLPPLRERKEDLPELIRAFVQRIARAVGRERVRVLPSALARLRSYGWPGNLRELSSVLERLVAFSGDGTITKRAVEEVLGEAVESLAAFRSRRERIEREELVELLRECGGNLAEVARRLDMSRSAVHYRVRKHGLLPVRRRRSPRRGTGRP